MELKDKSRYLSSWKTIGDFGSSPGPWMLEIWLRAKRSLRRLGRSERGRSEEIVVKELRSSFNSVRLFGMSLNTGVLFIASGMHDRLLRERSRILSKGVKGITLANPSYDSSVSSSSRDVILSKPVSRVSSSGTSREVNLLPLKRRECSLGRPRHITSTLFRDSKRFLERLRSSISVSDC